ncbi:MAG: hypothetical protein P1U41_07275 [Vicingaceae bacterium]|nr:hypothetical protein [Vicingaceae bacterium]
MNKNIEKALEKAKYIKLKIDNRTVITVRSKAMLKTWLEKFPKAQIIV